MARNTFEKRFVSEWATEQAIYFNWDITDIKLLR